MEDKTPDRMCGIVTEGTCDRFNNATLTLECFPQNQGIIGDLAPVHKCEATVWSGCYRKFSKL